ncbi:MAG: DUF4012 domain-containing protein [Chloroflexi bacterium]|nr:DUF4012 domain-containing protein [Chloroflexota bacterium]
MSARFRAPSGRVWIALGITLVVVVAVGFGAWRVIVLQQTAQDARDHLTNARTALSEVVVASAPESPIRALGEAQVTSACAEASAAAESLRDVNGQLQTVMPLVGALESVPGLGARARSQTTTLQAGTELATAGASLCEGLGPLTSLLSGGPSEDGPRSAREIVQALASARPKLTQATQRLEQLQISLKGIQDADLEPSNRAAFISMRDRLPAALKTMQDAALLIDLLGGQRTQHYLLISQNPDELRATGGYIGSAGVVEATAGTIRLVEYGSSRRYDTPLDRRATPPADFQAYLGVNSWNLAGANWWASFPDVARQITYFYGLSHPDSPIDGVVALDQLGLGHLLEALGPVEVPEYSETVSAVDLEAKLDRYVHAGDPTDENGRKQFTAALSTAVLQRVLSAPKASLPAVVKAVRASFDEQHLLISVTEPEGAKLFAGRHWDGAILPAAGDALMLVDADVAGTKQSQAISRDATYNVALSPEDRPQASLEVVYTNGSKRGERPDVPFVTVYRTFLRVLVPAGAELVASSGFDAGVSVSEECGRRVFGGQVSIGETTSTHVLLEYQLPSTLGAGNYGLLVQQQPGVPPGHITVGVSTGGSPTARADVRNIPGQHMQLQLDPSSQPDGLKTAALPDAAPGGCGLSLVEAQSTFPPVSIAAPGAGIDAQVVELGVSPDGQMEAPSNPDVVGWYRMSSRPGGWLVPGSRTSNGPGMNGGH